MLQEARLSFSPRTLTAVLVLAALPCAAQAPTKATLDVSETLFSVISAINVCGYDQELAASLPIRLQVRAQLVEAERRLLADPLRASRLAELKSVLGQLRTEAKAKGLDKITERRIDAEVQVVRKQRRKKSKSPAK